jgi:hypothetical protein
MAEKDLHSKVQAVNALDYGAITTNTTTTGNEIDTLGFESVEFVIQTGTYTDGDYVVTVDQAADDGAGAPDAGTWAALPDISAEVGAGATLGGPINIGAGDSDSVFRIGSVGKERHLRLSIVSTSVTTGTEITAVAILSDPQVKAVADQNT